MFNTLNYTNAMIKLASRFLLFRLGVASSFRSAYLDTISYIYLEICILKS